MILNRPVLLECIYASGWYPWLNLKFTNGQATITDSEQLDKIKKTTGWGKEFGVFGMIRGGGRANVVRVQKSQSSVHLTVEEYNALMAKAGLTPGEAPHSHAALPEADFGPKDDDGRIELEDAQLTRSVREERQREREAAGGTLK